ncbi:MAG: MFS transporter [Bacillota bacterium]|nr:MFS transporter [Bacillota bacterium]
MTEVKGNNFMSKRFVLVMVLYLLGLFMGALDTGIVTPARTVIQADLGVDASTGIWMITIYTLFYAASIPVMGKFADMYGRKYIYIASISLFGLGSLFCGLASNFDSFTILVIARAVQAVGGGGIMPIATAEFGTSFPPEKRGMALGLVGGVYGIANVFGASVGSLIMDMFGTENWAYIFYLNVPITIFIVIGGLVYLSNNREEDSGKLDVLGIMIVVVMIFALMYGLKKLDFFDFKASITDSQVYVFLLIFAMLLPVFILVEKRAANPVINLSYFTDRNIAIALVVSVISGFTLMGVIFVPQLSENALLMSTGSGGYLVIFLGIFMGGAAPISGKFVDKYGARVVLLFGFLVTAIGALFLVFVTCNKPNMLTVLVGLGIIGLGMGFTVGTPLNYIMLANTDDKDSNSALATMSLIRSIGTAIAPAIMVGFISHAGMMVQDNIMGVLPQEIKIPKLPYYQEIQKEFDSLKSDPDIAEQMGDMDMDLPDMGSINIGDMSDSDYEIPEDMLTMLQSSDVTTIATDMKTFACAMFDDMVPDILKDIDSGIGEGMDGINKGKDEILNAVGEMQKGYDGIDKGIAGINSGMDSIEKAKKQLKNSGKMLKSFGNDTFPNNMSCADFIPAKAQASMPPSVLDTMKSIKSRKQLKGQIGTLSGITSSLKSSAGTLNKYKNSFDAYEDGIIPEGKTLKDIMSDEDYGSLPGSVKGRAAAVTSAAELEAFIGSIQQEAGGMQGALNQMNQMDSMLGEFGAGRIPSGMSLLDFMPPKISNSLPAKVKKTMKGIHSTSDINKSVSEMDKAEAEMQESIKKMEASQKEMVQAMSKMKFTAVRLDKLNFKLGKLKEALPGAFDEAEKQYLVSIDERETAIEKIFQNTLNTGFKKIFLMVVVLSLLAMILLAGYSEKRESNMTQDV